MEIKIVSDEDVESPRELGGNLGIMVCFHKKYQLGDKHSLKPDDFSGWDDLESYLKSEENASHILPMYMYDHGMITINTTGFSCPFDSGQIGFIYTTEERIKNIMGVITIDDEAIDILKAEVEEYDSYLEGNACGYIIMDDGEEICSCYGFYSEDEAREAAQEDIDHMLHDEYEREESMRYMEMEEEFREEENE